MMIEWSSLFGHLFAILFYFQTLKKEREDRCRPFLIALKRTPTFSLLEKSWKHREKFHGKERTKKTEESFGDGARRSDDVKVRNNTKQGSISPTPFAQSINVPAYGI